MTLTYSLVLMLAILSAAEGSIGPRLNSTLCTGSSYMSICSGHHQLSCEQQGFIVLMNAQNRFISSDHECASNKYITCGRPQQCCWHYSGSYCEERIGSSVIDYISKNCISKRSCSTIYPPLRLDACRLQRSNQQFEADAYLSEVNYTCVADNAVLTTTGPSSSIDHVRLATFLWTRNRLIDGGRQSHYGTCYVNASSGARRVRLYSLALRGEYYNTYSNNYNWNVTVEDARGRNHKFNRTNTTNRDANSWNNSVAHVIDTLQLPVTVRVKVPALFLSPALLWIGFEAECGTISMTCQSDDANSYRPFQVHYPDQSETTSWHKIVQCQNDSQQQQHHGSGPNNTGVIVGVTMGVLAVIAIAVIVGVVVYRRRSETSKESRLESHDQVYHVPVTDTSSSTPAVWNPGYRGKTPGHKRPCGKKAVRADKGREEEESGIDEESFDSDREDYHTVSYIANFSADGKKPVPRQDNVYLELLDDQCDNLATVTLPQDTRNLTVLGPSRWSGGNSNRGPLPPLPPSGVNPGSKQQTTSGNLPTSTSPRPGHYASAPVPSVHGQTQQTTAPRDQACLMTGPVVDQPQQRAASNNHISTSEPKPCVTNPDYDYLPPSYDVLDARPKPPEYSKLSNGLQQQENPVTLGQC